MPIEPDSTRSRRLLTVALFGCLLIATACAPRITPQPAAPRTMHFMAGYKPQANLPFVGAYVAQSQGYFADQGLTVEISHSAGQGEHLKLMLQGTVDVTTGEGDAVLGRRSEGLPVVAIALIGQRGNKSYAVLADSDIRTPRDWEGRLVGYKVIPTPDYLALLRSSGVDRSRLQEVPVGFDPRLLAAGKVDVYPVFESNEPNTLERLGSPVRLFRPSDYGVPSMGLTYLTRQQLVEQDPELLQRFLKATLRGILFARDFPEQATDIIMQYAPNEDREHQLFMLKVELDMAESALTKTHGLGWQTREQWQALHDTLLEFDGLKAATDVDGVFTDRILQSVYRNGQLVWP